MKLPKNNSGLFAKKFVSQKVEESEARFEFERASSKDKKISTPNPRYQSPRALKYADYINKVVEKDSKAKPPIKVPIIKRSNSANRNFAI